MDPDWDDDDIGVTYHCPIETYQGLEMNVWVIDPIADESKEYNVDDFLVINFAVDVDLEHLEKPYSASRGALLWDYEEEWIDTHHLDYQDDLDQGDLPHSRSEEIVDYLWIFHYWRPIDYSYFIKKIPKLPKVMNR